MARNTRGDDSHLIECQRGSRSVRYREVAEMERVERAPDETDAARRRHSSGQDSKSGLGLRIADCGLWIVDCGIVWLPRIRGHAASSSRSSPAPVTAEM